MKITTKQYAQSLYEVVFKAEDGALKVVIKNFVQLLAARNNLGKADEIVREFGKIWNRERGIVEGELVSAHKLNDEIVALLHGSIAPLLGAKELKLENKIDKDIMGGFVVHMEDVVIDGSLKRQLQTLKSKLVN
ncbi:MAG: ATP synthase F1 subunit delta [Methanoregula sp.]|nr:ATP synthase F1 subunit delta [Methanoregula sp.]